MKPNPIAFAISLCLAFVAALVGAAPLTRESVLAATLKPYMGPSVKGVDTSTLSNKVMCGYQGWFNVEGDGAERDWVHWTKRRGPLRPANAKIDLWPDVSELGVDERFAIRKIAFAGVDGMEHGFESMCTQSTNHRGAVAQIGSKSERQKKDKAHA